MAELRRQSVRAGLGLVLLAGLLAGCEADAPAAGTSPSPAADAGAAQALVQPPKAPLTAGESSPAATALIAAATRTAEAGSLRLHLTGSIKDPRSGRNLAIDGTGEAESTARSHVLTSFAVSGRTVATEAVTYDGQTWTRSQGGTWHKVAAATASADPRGYLSYLSGVTGVADLGLGQHNGAEARHYSAAAVLRKGATPSAAPAGPLASPVTRGTTIEAWVDPGSGRLTALAVIIPDTGQGGGALSIDFSDFGAAITVALPPAAP